MEPIPTSALHTLSCPQHCPAVSAGDAGGHPSLPGSWVGAFLGQGVFKAWAQVSSHGGLMARPGQVSSLGECRLLPERLRSVSDLYQCLEHCRGPTDRC